MSIYGMLPFPVAACSSGSESMAWGHGRILSHLPYRSTCHRNFAPECSSGFSGNSMERRVDWLEPNRSDLVMWSLDVNLNLGSPICQVYLMALAHPLRNGSANATYSGVPNRCQLQVQKHINTFIHSPQISSFTTYSTPTTLQPHFA